MLPLPGISGNRIKLSKSGYFKAISLGLLIIAAITIYVLQFDHFDKMLNIPYFLILSAILGLISGGLLGRKYTNEEQESYDQMRIYIMCIVLSIAFMPLLVSLVNRYLDFQTPQYQEAQLLESHGKIDQPYGYLKGEKKIITHYESTILLEEKIYKFSTTSNPFPEKIPGDKIQLPVNKGLLGIKYLKL